MNHKEYEKSTSEIIKQLDLDEVQKALIFQNWLSFICHLEKRIDVNYERNKWLSIIGIIGGISIPAISSFSPNDHDLKIIVSVVGIITASSIAVNQNQKYNEKWKHFRRMVEYARVEGENYLSNAGEKYNGKSHKDNFSEFMSNLSKIKNAEIEGYFDNLDGTIKK